MENNIEAPEFTTEELNEMLQIRRNKLDELKKAGKNPFEITKFDVTHYSEGVISSYVEPEGGEAHGEVDESALPVVSVAGRIMLKRIMGKASFFHIQDKEGKIQIYIRSNDVGAEAYQDFKTYDIGDIVGIKGTVFKTKTGEITIKTKEIVLLCKSLQLLPEKRHGLKDLDTRYRQRYVDLIVNPEVRDVFVKRSQIIKEVRNYLDNRAFIEVETPVLHSIAGGAAARPFITHHNTLDIDMYLRIALELHLKRLIVGGLDRVYEIGRVFRNEGMDPKHNPEFTLLELYQAYTDYNGMMDITEGMIRHVCNVVNGTGKIMFGDIEIDLDKPFKRVTMSGAVLEYSGVDFTKVKSLEEARALAKEHHIEYEERHAIGDILNLFFEEYVEKNLVQPTFVMNHPVDISPLAKRMPENPEYTERFELFIVGSEFANAFSELNDPIDQRERFERQAALKAAGDDEACDVDNDFLNALEIGMPPTGGMGMGIDRLVMLLTNTRSIRDVLLFPTMKSLDK